MNPLLSPEVVVGFNKNRRPFPIGMSGHNQQNKQGGKGGKNENGQKIMKDKQKAHHC